MEAFFFPDFIDTVNIRTHFGSDESSTGAALASGESRDEDAAQSNP